MNKIELIEHLASLFRDDRYDSASLLLISDGRIITGRPMFNDSEVPDDHASTSRIFDFVKQKQLYMSESTALLADKDGFLLEKVSVKQSSGNIESALLYVFYDSISSVTIIP